MEVDIGKGVPRVMVAGHVQFVTVVL